MHNTICYELHKLFNGVKRYTFETIDDIPFDNGIYIFFEKGEKYGEFDRIVRVGTDTGQNQLKSRMRQHLTKENKDRSIFRKNIGRAMLAKENNPLLNYWNIDFTTKKNKELFFDEKKFAECAVIEKDISTFMKENLSFVVFCVNTKEERLRFEKGIISALYNADDFVASAEWLGNYVPETKGTHVKKSRMWLSQGLRAKPLDNKELKKIQLLCQQNNF